MRILTLFALLSALLVPAMTWGVTVPCTPSTASAQDWGDITTLSPTANCTDKAAPPDDDDILTVGLSGEVNIVDNITYGTGGDGALRIRGGGLLTVDIPTLQQVVTIHFSAGMDAITVNEVEYNSVAIWEEAGGQTDFQGAYLTWGLATPQWLETVTSSNHTMWVADKVAPCDVAGINTEGGEIGGTGDCATGVEENQFTLAYTNARNNPNDGSDGDTYLHESIGELTEQMFVCMISGMDRNHCYRIEDLEQTPGIYNISLDVLQVVQPLAGGADYAAWPLANRAQQLVANLTAANAGDTCVQYAGGLLTADGQYDDFCAYLFDASGANGWPRPMRIGRTEDDETCDGTTGGGEESFHFTDPLPYDVVTNADMVISPVCIGKGDKFAVGAFLIIEVEDDSGEWVSEDGKILLEGNNIWRGVVIDGSGEIVCSGCTMNQDQVHTWNSGSDAKPAWLVEDTSGFSLSCGSIIGGPQTGAANGFLFKDVTGPVDISDVNWRYNGGRAIDTQASGSMPSLKLTRVGLERTSKIVTVALNVSFFITASSFQTVTLVDLYGGDPTPNDSSYVLQALSKDNAVLNGLGITGQKFGGIVNADTTDSVKVYNVLSREVDTALGSGKTYLGHYSMFGDFGNFHLDSSTPLIGNQKAVTFKNNDIHGFTTSNDVVIDATERLSEAVDIQNNRFHNTDSSHANCLNGTGCWIIYYDPDDDGGTATVSTIEHQMFTWDFGETTKWTGAIYSPSTTGDALYFGGNAVDGMVNDDDDANLLPIDLDATVAAVTTQRKNASNNCVGYAAVTGTGAVTYVDSWGSYTVPPLSGVGAEFEQGTGRLRPNAVWAQKDCGTLVRTRAPGLGPGHDFIYERMGVTPPERKPLVKRGVDGEAF